MTNIAQQSESHARRTSTIITHASMIYETMERVQPVQMYNQVSRLTK